MKAQKSHQAVNWKVGGFSIGQASNNTTEFTLLIGDTDIDIGNLPMVIDLDGLGDKHIARLGTVEKHDVVLNAKGESTPAIHHSSQGNIGQCEVGSTLTDASRIQVFRRDNQLGTGIAFAYLF